MTIDRPQGVDTRSDFGEIFEEIYREHAPVLMAKVLRLVSGDHQYAEDVVQETLLRAWKYRDSLRFGPAGLRPWLVTTARHIVIDAYRARRARPEIAMTQVEDIATPDQIDMALLSITLADAVAALPQKHRAVLVETHFKGATSIEAARTLGLPDGTVRSRNFYALRALKLMLEERRIAP
ncbi:sigma-70 family RNA polymerase sigma factor [Streptomyces sp. NPDC056661]|uniref:sigma-70 family RNA polymerase sigma factor n=1 Tax=Streptomyces sp. NPDC056661 TaxID=3345898 RepID=UPI0036CF1644